MSLLGGPGWFVVPTLVIFGHFLAIISHPSIYKWKHWSLTIPMFKTVEKSFQMKVWTLMIQRNLMISGIR